MKPASDKQQKFALEIVQKLRGAGYTALWAGGCVRDLLLGKLPQDYDVATDARPQTVQELFGRRKTRAVGAAFGVILVHGPSGSGDVEVATFRAEGPYLDGRRPQHVVFCTPEEDAQRRDFTINGMFLDPVANKVLDYVGGQKDLSKRIIRAIGDPLERFREDKLRLLRALRFSGNLDFKLDPATAKAVRTMAPEIHAVSPERITQELKRMLVDPHRDISMRLAHDLALLSEILPEVTPLLASDQFAAWDHTLARLKFLLHPQFETALASLLWSLPEIDSALLRKLAKRLKFSNQELHNLDWLFAHRDSVEEIRSAPLSTLKKLLVAPEFPELALLLRADAEARGGSSPDLDYCEQYLRDIPPAELNPPPLLTGDDLVAQGIKPGPKFKRLLEILRDAQLENRVRTPDDAWNLIHQLQKSPKQDSDD
ncbi:MAG: CCA tRNA nucleotidyltransferase [Planctomycetales bacterium]